MADEKKAQRPAPMAGKTRATAENVKDALMREGATLTTGHGDSSNSVV